MASITPDNLTAIRDNTFEDPQRRAPLVLGDQSYGDVTAAVSDIALKPIKKTRLPWVIGFIISLSLLGMLTCLIGYLLLTGVGVWGNNNTVAWGFPIVNFVFWVGIGHAGTLISAILFLFRQDWRTGINRFAEAMTIFAVMCAGLFPGIHVGRAWLAYWLFPYPNQMAMWPNFRSPLLWDVFAVSTYATVSMLFWYMGMIPDIATLRDRAKDKPRQIIYGILALGWRGSNRHWHRYEKAYLLLAALATPLVLSVHSVVSFDFAVSQLPGWHTTIFPPYFVAGAIFGGFAMVLCLLIPARQWYGLENLITRRHVDNCAKVLLATGMIVGYAYLIEIFTAWYSGVKLEQETFLNRAFGPYGWSFWLMMFCNLAAPQLMWFKSMRNNMLIVWIVALLANVGMWFERFVIIITSLTRPHLPSSWTAFTPTWVDYAMLLGSFGLFFTFFLLFCRFLPMVAISEVKAIMPRPGAGHDAKASPTDDRDGGGSTAPAT